MKTKIVTVIGARPQIIKSSAISRAIRNKYHDKLEEVIVHTGQHYDDNMSQVFFVELNIPSPKYNLKIGSASHAVQTAEMMKGLEDVFKKEQPQAVILYGDTNSTLAGATVASKMDIPVVHVESGLRSYNKAMPEEINRIVSDHLSTLLFTPTELGVANLKKEGFNLENNAPYNIDNPKVHYCGDVMYDNSLHFAELAMKKETVLTDYNLVEGTFILCTLHRPANTDSPERLANILEALVHISTKGKEVIVPLHPRTRKFINETLDKKLLDEIENTDTIKLIDPVSFLNITALEQKCAFIITDSGGLQKEAYFFQKPSIILRAETEWMEIVANGNATLVDADKQRIIEAAYTYLNGVEMEFPNFYGNGKAAEFICDQLIALA